MDLPSSDSRSGVSLLCHWGPSNSIRCSVKEGAFVYLGAQPPFHYFPTDEWFGELLAESPPGGVRSTVVGNISTWRRRRRVWLPGHHTLETRALGTTPWRPRPGDHTLGTTPWGPHPGGQSPGDHTMETKAWGPRPGDHRPGEQHPGDKSPGDHTLRTTPWGPHPALESKLSHVFPIPSFHSLLYLQ